MKEKEKEKKRKDLVYKWYQKVSQQNTKREATF